LVPQLCFGSRSTAKPAGSAGGAGGEAQRGGPLLVAPGDGGPALAVADDRAGLAPVDDALGLVPAAEVLLCGAPVLHGIEHDGGVVGDLLLRGDVGLVLGPVPALEEGVEVVPTAAVPDLDGGVAGPAHVATLPAGRLVERLEDGVLAAAERPAVDVDDLERADRLRLLLRGVGVVEDRAVQVLVDRDRLLVVRLRARAGDDVAHDALERRGVHGAVAHDLEVLHVRARCGGEEQEGGQGDDRSHGRACGSDA
jgi:hypothetical protein